MRRPVVAVLGAGRFAAALSRIFIAKEIAFRVWVRDTSVGRAASLGTPEETLSTDIGDVTKDADLVFFAVPASAIGEVARRYGAFARPDQVVVHAARGTGAGFSLPHRLIRESTCVRKVGALGGPLHASDLGTGQLLAAVVGTRFSEVTRLLRRLTEGTPIRIHESSDLVGVEVAGAISNVSALAKGIADELGLGDTARGILLTHGLVEAQRLGIALGADAGTFTGLAGVGDLIPRSVASTDRHLEVGRRLAREDRISDVLSAIGGEVEGVVTALEADVLAEKKGLHLPLVRAVATILRDGASAQDALERVLVLDDIELVR